MDGVNIKDLILDENEREILSSKKAGKKKEYPVRFDLIAQSGPDFAIERTCNRKKSRLVILVSQNQFYIEEAGKKRVALNRKRMSEFLKGLNKRTIELPEVSWISRVRGSSDFVSKFVGFVLNDATMQLAKKGNIFLPDSIGTLELYDFSKFGLRRCRKMEINGEGRYEEQYEGHPMPFGYQNPLDDPAGNLGREFRINPMDNLFASWLGGTHGMRIPYTRRSYTYDPWENSFFGHFDEGWHCMNRMEDLLSGGVWEGDVTPWICICMFMYKVNPALYDYMIKELAAAGNISKKELFEKYLSDFESQEFLCFQSFFSFALIGSRFGIEYAKEAMRMYLKSGIMDIIPFQELSILLYGQNDLLYVNIARYGREAAICEFEPKRFLKYLLKESEEQGYGGRMGRFLLEWADILLIQRYLFENIEDKYPSHLASSEVKYVSLAERYRSTIYDNMWKEASEKMKPFEYKGSKYQIVCPKSTADLMAEANQQRNCVANYEKELLSGNTMIFFMRSSNPATMDRSILTIELSPEGTIDQVKARFNDAPGISQLAFIKKWAKEKGLRLTEDVYPVYFGNDYWDKEDEDEDEDEVDSAAEVYE